MRLSKIIFFFLLNLIMYHETQSMEQESYEEETDNYIAIPEIIPDELLSGLLTLANGSNAPLIFDSQRTFCIQFGKRNVPFTKTHKVRLARSSAWVAPINLNTVEFYRHFDIPGFYFPIRCDKKARCSGYMFNRRIYCIEIENDTINLRHNYSTITRIENRDLYFDGPNDNGIFIIAANSKKKETIKEEYYKKYTPKLLGAPLITFKKRIPAVSDFVYTTKIGNYSTMDTTNSPLAHLNNYINTTCAPLERGSAVAVALCKTKNRYVIANNKDQLTLHSIPRTRSAEIKQIGFGQFKTSIKKISFLTPTLLLGLIGNGKLFSFSLDEKSKKIHAARQKIVTMDKEPIFLHTFAVDPCNTHKIIFCTKDNRIMYINLTNCHDSTLWKKGIFLMEVRAKPKYLWFYDSKVCLGYINADKEVTTTNYSLYDFNCHLNN